MQYKNHINLVNNTINDNTIFRKALNSKLPYRFHPIWQSLSVQNDCREDENNMLVARLDLH